MRWFASTGEVFSQVLVREEIGGTQIIDVHSEPVARSANIKSTFTLTDPIVDIVLDSTTRGAAASDLNQLPGTLVTRSGKRLRMRVELVSNPTARSAEPTITAELVPAAAASSSSTSSPGTTSTPTASSVSAP